jgi:hypothetical protein
MLITSIPEMALVLAPLSMMGFLAPPEAEGVAEDMKSKDDDVDDEGCAVTRLLFENISPNADDDEWGTFVVAAATNDVEDKPNASKVLDVVGWVLTGAAAPNASNANDCEGAGDAESADLPLFVATDAEGENESNTGRAGGGFEDDDVWNVPKSSSASRPPPPWVPWFSWNTDAGGAAGDDPKSSKSATATGGDDGARNDEEDPGALAAEAGRRNSLLEDETCAAPALGVAKAFPGDGGYCCSVEGATTGAGCGLALLLLPALP